MRVSNFRGAQNHIKLSAHKEDKCSPAFRGARNRRNDYILYKYQESLNREMFKTQGERKFLKGTGIIGGIGILISL